MKALLLIAGILLSGTLLAQNSDRLYFHNGNTVKGDIVRISAFTIEYRNQGEQLIRTTSRHAVEKIELGGANKTELITQKITINSESDWAKVVLLEDNSEINLLNRKEQVYGWASTGFRSVSGTDEKADESLKKEAATKGYPFVLVKSHTLSDGRLLKKGIGYTY